MLASALAAAGASDAAGELGPGELAVMVAVLLVVAILAWRFVRWAPGWVRWWLGTRASRLLASTLLAMMVLGILGTRVARLDLRYDQARVATAQQAETFYIPPPIALKVAALGHEAFFADMLFVRANMYFVNHLLGDRIFAWLDVYLESMLALDPNNPRIYEWASQVSKYGQMITNTAVERSISYSRRGIERFPDHWRFYLDVGFNYMMEWRTETEEERQAMRDKALPYFALAAALPDSRLDPNFVAELYLQKNDVEMALFHAYLRYWEGSDRERAALRGRITRYESRAVAEHLARVEDRWRQEHPYVPVSLFEQLGERHDEVVRRSWTESGLGGREEGDR